MSPSNYALRFSTQAAESLRLIAANSPHVWPAVRAGLQRFSLSPTRLSRPSISPFDPDSQMYRFAVSPVGECVVLFHYESDEQTLLIDDVVLWSP